jgi:segregation and condensation protein B
MEDLKTIIESLLFVADNPMSIEKLADVIEEADAKAIRSALTELLREFDDPKRGFQLREVAGGYQFRTHPECQAYIKRLLKPTPSRLSRAALETLAIIAYKQPIIRSDVEHIRGVDSGGVLRVLMEKKLVRVLGRREIPGRPLIYATTKHFLEVFDLKNLRDLPTPKEIEELTAQEPEIEAPPSGEPEPDTAEATRTPDGGPDEKGYGETQQEPPGTPQALPDTGTHEDLDTLTEAPEGQLVHPQPHHLPPEDDALKTLRPPSPEADLNEGQKSAPVNDEDDA